MRLSSSKLLEAIVPRGRPSLLGWRPFPLGWRPSLVGRRPLLLGWIAVATGLEAIALRALSCSVLPSCPVNFLPRQSAVSSAVSLRLSPPALCTSVQQGTALSSFFLYYNLYYNVVVCDSHSSSTVLHLNVDFLYGKTYSTTLTCRTFGWEVFDFVFNCAVCHSPSSRLRFRKSTSPRPRFSIDSAQRLACYVANTCPRSDIPTLGTGKTSSTARFESLAMTQLLLDRWIGCACSCSAAT